MDIVHADADNVPAATGHFEPLTEQEHTNYVYRSIRFQYGNELSEKAQASLNKRKVAPLVNFLTQIAEEEFERAEYTGEDETYQEFARGVQIEGFSRGSTSLHTAVYMVNSVASIDDSAVKALLQYHHSDSGKPVGIDTQNNDGKMPLHFATLRYTAERLLEYTNEQGLPYGLDVVDSNGDTPLLIAAKSGSTHYYEYLLSVYAEYKGIFTEELLIHFFNKLSESWDSRAEKRLNQFLEQIKIEPNLLKAAASAALVHHEDNELLRSLAAVTLAKGAGVTDCASTLFQRYEKSEESEKKEEVKLAPCSPK